MADSAYGHAHAYQIGGSSGTSTVVLKFDSNVMRHGRLGFIRSLGRVSVPVYGVRKGPWAPAASFRHPASARPLSRSQQCR